MKRVLVTGANGFVCSNIVTALLQHGYFVYAVDLQWDNLVVQSWSNEQLEFITSDCVSLPEYELDALVHGAALTADASELGLSAEDYFEAHLQPTLAMFRYAENHVSGRSVFISSSAVYREMTGLSDEETPSNPLGLYAVAKQMTESLIDTLCSEYQRDICVIRLGNIYGPNEFVRQSRPRVSMIRQMIESAKTTGEIVLYKDMPFREWTFAPDIGQAVVQLLNQEIINFSLYNLAAAQSFAWREIAEAIAATISNVTIRESVQAELEMPVLTRRGLLDNTRLQAEIGLQQWTSLQDGIRLTIESLSEEAHHA